MIAVPLGSRTRSVVAALCFVVLVEIALAIFVDRELRMIGDGGSVARGRAVLVVATSVGLAAVAFAIAKAFRTRAVPSVPADVDDEADDARRRTLAAEHNRFEAVLQTMAPAVIALDGEHHVTTVNLGARRLLGLPDVVEGRPLVDLVRLPALHALLDRAHEGGTELADIDLPGQRQVLGRATRQADGGIVVVLDDVTEVRRLERVRKDFVANVSHELRTPISVIKANAETLLEGALDDPPAARRFVEGLYRHADRLGRLVSDLLDISQLESGRRELADEPILVAEVAEEVVESLLGEAEAKGVTITVSVPDDLEVRADPKALEQVFFNLVDNAIKYSPTGSRVEVAALLQPDAVRIEVRDDGPGIDPKHRVRIFERFYRVDPGRSREMGGTGLGLSIVKHLVDSLGGELGVEPRRPRGSIFWFRLPNVGGGSADSSNPSQSQGLG